MDVENLENVELAQFAQTGAAIIQRQWNDSPIQDNLAPFKGKNEKPLLIGWIGMAATPMQRTGSRVFQELFDIFSPIV